MSLTSSKIVPPVPVSVWLATLTLSLFGLAMPLVMLQIFDRIIPFQATETLLVLLMGLVVVVPLEMLQRILRSSIMTVQATRYSGALAAKILHRVLHVRARDAPRDLSRVHSYLMASGKIRDHVGGVGRLYLIELPFAFLALALIAILAGPLVFVPLAGFALLIAVAAVVRRVHRRNLTAREAADDRRYDLFEQMIEHIQIVKANQMENGLASQFRKQQRRAVSASQSVYFSSNLFQSFAQSISLAFSAAIVCAGAYLVLKGQIGAAELAACTMLNGRAAQPLMNAIQQWTSAESFSKSRKTVEAALALPQTSPLPDSKEALTARGAQISFGDVTVRASQTGRAVLRNFSFDAKGGFVTVTAGATGNARAMFKCILGETIPMRGSVRVNGVSARAMSRFRGAGGIIYVDGTPPSFEGTLLYNIALSDDPDIMDCAYEAAQRLGLDQDINKLPNGYESDLRASGILMASRGFLQRINIARALTHRPSILLLDDALCAMDGGMQLRTAAALQSYAKDHMVLAYDSTGLLERFSDRTVSIATPSRARRVTGAQEDALAWLDRRGAA